MFEKIVLIINVQVTSGWYHCVARGITAKGELKFFAWGRNDMSQFIAEDNQHVNGKNCIAFHAQQ